MIDRDSFCRPGIGWINYAKLVSFQKVFFLQLKWLLTGMNKVTGNFQFRFQSGYNLSYHKRKIF